MNINKNISNITITNTWCVFCDFFTESLSKPTLSRDMLSIKLAESSIPNDAWNKIAMQNRFHPMDAVTRNQKLDIYIDLRVRFYEEVIRGTHLLSPIFISNMITYWFVRKMILLTRQCCELQYIEMTRFKWLLCIYITYYVICVIYCYILYGRVVFYEVLNEYCYLSVVAHYYAQSIATSILWNEKLYQICRSIGI